MRFYGLTDSELLAMPAKRFWLLEKNVSRIQAHEAMQSIPLVQCAMGGDGVKDYQSTLTNALGKIHETQLLPQRTDEATKARLRALSNKAK